jgi:hypothetical protein
MVTLFNQIVRGAKHRTILHRDRNVSSQWTAPFLKQFAIGNIEELKKPEAAHSAQRLNLDKARRRLCNLDWVKRNDHC